MRATIKQKIQEHLLEVLPELQIKTLQDSDRLADLGANSVDRADIVMMTMESFDLDIPRIELFGAQNIGELVTLFEQKLQKKGP